MDIYKTFVRDEKSSIKPNKTVTQFDYDECETWMKRFMKEIPQNWQGAKDNKTIKDFCLQRLRNLYTKQRGRRRGHCVASNPKARREKTADTSGVNENASKGLPYDPTRSSEGSQ